MNIHELLFTEREACAYFEVFPRVRCNAASYGRLQYPQQVFAPLSRRSLSKKDADIVLD